MTQATLPQETASPTEAQDELTQAVQKLNALAQLKSKVQESRADALQVWATVNRLFSDEEMDEEEIASLKDGLKSLKNYAQLNLRFTHARSEGEEARKVLDQALGRA